MLSGLCFGPIYKEQWGIQKRNVDFFDVKADVEALLSMTRLKSNSTVFIQLFILDNQQIFFLREII